MVLLVLGVFLNLIGFVILFVYNAKPMPDITYTTLIYNTEEMKAKNEKLEIERARFRKWSKIGMAVNIVGFLLQLIGLLL